MIIWLFRGTTQQKIITWLRVLVGFGLAFMFGLGKLTGGSETLIMYGSAMQYVGIWFGFAFWWLMAWIAEFVWGVALALGYKTRLAAIFIVFVMIIATIAHLSATEWMLAEMGPGMAIMVWIIALWFAIYPNKGNSICDKC
jgi:putative oxidoreductase